MHEVARPENLQLCSWEFRFKTKTCSEFWRMCLVIASSVGGNDACDLDTENGCFQT